MPKPWKEREPSRTATVRAFLRDAFSDYIAARVLFLADLPQQGAVLSSTAIEKCVKALLAIRGNKCHGHLKSAHWNVLKNDWDLGTLLDRDFVELNRRAYGLRYTDDIPPETNLVIASREFLAEMDHTILSILSCFQFEPDGKPPQRPYEPLLKKSDQRLLLDNCVLSSVSKEFFIYERPQFVYELRRDAARGLMEVTYTTDKAAKSKGFLRPALVLLGNQVDYDLSHFPVPGSLTFLSQGYELRGQPLTESDESAK